MRTRKRTLPPKDHNSYRQLWRLVDGAVADAFKNHPDYLAEQGEKTVRQSINKRVVGTVLGYVGETQRRADLVNGPAADRSELPSIGAQLEGRLPEPLRATDTTRFRDRWRWVVLAARRLISPPPHEEKRE